jgi:hypothetical protein
VTDTTAPELPPRFLTPDIVIGTPGSPQSWNRYASCLNNPVNYVDLDGMLESYFMSLNSQETTTLEHHQNIDGFTWITSSRVFSGEGEHRNKPESTNIKDKGPIPTGTYYIVDRPEGGTLDQIVSWLRDKDEWFALYRKDETIDDWTEIGEVKRGLFRLHLGTISFGCITFCDEKEFKLERERLLKTERDLIPDTNILHYGTIEVE